MPTKPEIDAEYQKFNKQRKKQGKKELTFREWYKLKFKTEPPSFVKDPKQKGTDINEYLKNILGKEPMGNYAKRRWRFLISFAKLAHEKKALTFDDVVRWFAKNCECMKPRTIKEAYVEYLATLGILDWNENGKTVKRKGETLEDD